ncbi:hypothetical protein [Allostreptomyces psammosilenae]|uniref:Uncharacterized protein n=1 Tax=Allostreptomyces psammosilenae TaxID=1892865 RepID=A0A852ZV43_9ACTN|nr:hypothetical protein [Allostreptomyces psammosilenae]NYI06263.1 hypothetical protein [Allostreptomyces psammosilenae]
MATTIKMTGFAAVAACRGTVSASGLESRAGLVPAQVLLAYRDGGFPGTGLPTGTPVRGGAALGGSLLGDGTGLGRGTGFGTTGGFDATRGFDARFGTGAGFGGALGFGRGAGFAAGSGSVVVEGAAKAAVARPRAIAPAAVWAEPTRAEVTTVAPATQHRNDVTQQDMRSLRGDHPWRHRD